MRQLSDTLAAMKLPEASQKGQKAGLTTIDGNAHIGQPVSMANPRAVDQHLKARLKSLPNSSVSYRKICVVDHEFGFLRTRDVPEIRSTSPDNLTETYREVVALCSPASRELIIKELTAMSLGMAKRKDQDADCRGLLIVYAGDLAEYPEDAIRTACGELRRNHVFFPTIAELRRACEEGFEFRQALEAELEALVHGTKLLAAPDPRAQMHFKSLEKKDWLPMHYDHSVAEAERMIALNREHNREQSADEWVVIAEERRAERDAKVSHLNSTNASTSRFETDRSDRR